MSKLHRSRLDTSFCTRRSGSSQLASDETLSRTACPGTELHCEPTRSVDQLCEMCRSPTLRSSTHCSDDVSVDPVIGLSTGGFDTNVTPGRQRLHSESGEGHDCRSRGTEASRGEGSTTTDDRVQHRVQFWSGIQCVDQLGDASAQRHFETTITSCLPDNSSLAPLCREHPSDGTDQSTTGKCSDDGRGPVKTLSGRLARKLQRSASLVNAGLLKQIQTVLDAANVDRCDFVEICCSDAPCLTGAMQQRCAQTASETTTYRHVRSSLAGFLRNDLGWHGSHHTGNCASEQFDTLRSSYQTDFSTVFRVCGSSLAIWWTHLLGMAYKVCRLVFCRVA